MGTRSTLVVRALRVCTLLLGMTCVDMANADHPSYLTLKTPVTRSPHAPTTGYYPGHAYDVTTDSYAYGWFGVQPKRHWSRQFGYYRNYTEWSSR